VSKLLNVTVEPWVQPNRNTYGETQSLVPGGTGFMAATLENLLSFGNRCNHRDAIEPIIRRNLDPRIQPFLVCADLFCERCGSIIATVYLRRGRSFAQAVAFKRKRPAYSEVF
jgi:hypothetical protein